MKPLLARAKSRIRLIDEEQVVMTAKMPNPIDVHVGSRLRMRRMLVGMSQEKLGEHLDLTFQQVQKYEKGSNRISASRLFDMARILDVPVQFFFDDMPGQPTGKPAEGFSESQDFVPDDGLPEQLRRGSADPGICRN
jgi:transcriptional regulator with XRE-family HTH domain